MKAADSEERFVRAYLNWTPLSQLALSAEYFYEWFEKEQAMVEEFTILRTHRIPLSLRYFNPNGVFAGVKATYVDQNGTFADPDPFALPGSTVVGSDQFWVVDASLGFRWPKRYGVLSIEGKNLFSQKFNFQDTDPTLPRIAPDRTVFLRFTAQF